MSSENQNEAARALPSFSWRHRLFRACWQITWVVLAGWTPPPLHPWRRLVLRAFGAKVRRLSDVRGSARVWYPPNLTLGEGALIGPKVICYNMAPIELERFALVSQGAHLCAGNHDIDDPDFKLFSRPIVLGEHSWVAADAFVAPGVTVGAGAVLGARAVALRDLEPWTLYVGNPAEPKRKRKRHSPNDHSA
ncbi:putative colanic acid biosynthesis acetyltransferase [Bradyrhizobium canariense]|nr:putative colanic acid biosynthesis acetyltransferase [Bradyrhizobium canariense]OSI34934.1 putative colanic acid biosynthesis acetyltransferase [Bradyrhizobium canariense]OSI51409.1 putative colanic acid biosynthesis acetyltransferase [Bradyrhizobium canariense]OSI54110.1 putative colanic acid biosynthesis acetyltransferase [Bradyrhizobium canariense]OSI57631.1 putative colanic acid biosynthesis acetyltransferase [Bradyrhizobium canariense]